MLCLGLLLGSLPPRAFAAQPVLPELGNAASATISPTQEKLIGKAFIRQLRGQIPTHEDPLLVNYLEHVLFLLASNSELEQPGQLELIVIASPQINAFAAPGGIIGLNSGLLLHAQSEDELSAVIAHELAHLSQRHFARGLDAGQRIAWTTMASLLASIAIAATAGGEAGMAAMAATQALSIDQQLRFSRQNEQEADRLGMQTLVNANMDPHAMPAFFERMLNAMRYSGAQAPEFLLTHPITQSRITDSRHRAAIFPQQPAKDSLEFELMKARLRVEFARDLSAMIKELEHANHNLQSRSNTITAATVATSNATASLAQADADEGTRYALAYAYLKAGQTAQAREQLQPLLHARPHRITYNVTMAAIDETEGDVNQAADRLAHELLIAPGNYALTISHVRTLLRLHQAREASTQLRLLLDKHAHRPTVWHLLAESLGQQKKLMEAHEARAESLFLYGFLDRALEQLEFALQLAANDSIASERIGRRIQSMKETRNHLRL
jgi:predicted Zn-dependent protease